MIKTYVNIHIDEHDMDEVSAILSKDGKYVSIYFGASTIHLAIEACHALIPILNKVAVSEAKSVEEISKVAAN